MLAQFVRSNLLLGQRALESRNPSQARRFFETVLSPPENLGEAKHLLANWSDVYFWIGISCAEESGRKRPRVRGRKLPGNMEIFRR